LVKAQLIYRDQGREVRRVGGCWINAPTDYAEFRVDESHELVIIVVRGAKAQTIAKSRVTIGLNSETIETKINSLPDMQDPTVIIRLTNADTGDFLFEQEFRIDLRRLRLTAI
jgi:hypothetical protein